jgi:hypothetical protein
MLTTTRVVSTIVDEIERLKEQLASQRDEQQAAPPKKTDTQPAEPATALRGEWLAKRMVLLQKEKQLSREAAEVARLRRDLPQVEMPHYKFDIATHPSREPGSHVALSDLFEGSEELILYHMMFSAESDSVCRMCSFFIDQVRINGIVLSSCIIIVLLRPGGPVILY